MQRSVSWGAALLVLLAGCASSDQEDQPPDRVVVAPGDVVGPPPGTRFDYQLGGAYPAADGVGIVVRDRTERPDPARYSVCYVNAFQTQPGADEVPAGLLLRTPGGSAVEDPDWPGEYLLDISTPARRSAVLDVVGPWFTGCADDGYAAVEPDNLDSWTRSAGLLTRADAVGMAGLLVTRAHTAGLAVAQKNAAELVGADLGFDFAVTEDCAAYDECARYAEAYGTVLEVEYADAPFADACAADRAGVAVLRRDRDLVPTGTAGYVAEWCPH